MNRTDIVPFDSWSSTIFACSSRSGSACSINRAGTPSLPNAFSSCFRRPIRPATSERRTVNIAFRSRTCVRTSTLLRAPPTSSRAWFSCSRSIDKYCSSASMSSSWLKSASYFTRAVSYSASSFAASRAFSDAWRSNLSISRFNDSKFAVATSKRRTCSWDSLPASSACRTASCAAASYPKAFSSASTADRACLASNA